MKLSKFFVIEELSILFTSRLIYASKEMTFSMVVVLPVCINDSHFFAIMEAQKTVIILCNLQMKVRKINREANTHCFP